MAISVHKPSKGITFKKPWLLPLKKKKKAIVDVWKLGLRVFVIPIIGQNCVHTLPLFKALLKVSITRLFK